MLRKSVTLAVIAMLLVSGLALTAYASTDPVSKDAAQFVRKSPWEILMEVSGTKEARVKRLVTEAGLVNAARKLGVLRDFLRALIDYKRTEIDHKAEMGLMTKEEAALRKEALAKRLAYRIARWIMVNWLGFDQVSAPDSDPSSDAQVIDLDIDPSLFLDDDFYHWQHNDDGTICK